MQFLNGDLVTLRLQKQGIAGDLARASEGHTDLIPDVYEGMSRVDMGIRDFVRRKSIWLV